MSHTTIGAAAFHFRVRDGIGWFHSANFTRETVGASPVAASSNVSTGVPGFACGSTYGAQPRIVNL
ncbi:hypothetical protein XAP412_740007 [Xanthomonas phaseoli pv. phaseoli]|uniref:Uncharacterized protein n=1 Tax=Xanthomonas campestris pv. phaseoli TaxID=317013 RepID=A0AB38E6A6_XANCH|nr:hypothetical protein XAP6984_780008 [Xanthomonas phaseoli pv. phaseoli]SON89682.1 hypothetical protein XAP412_740007 [Xanthomonas phaseoli pv. phaseoli]SON92306.1 hypothetical protein XAP7430_740007 [Xanthomonas phaseoli pv. phaseoli]